jgi:hypothetical protein
MAKEKKSAREIAAMIEERISGRATVSVVKDHPINGWYAMVIAPGNPNLLDLQVEVDGISDALRDRYELIEQSRA